MQQKHSDASILKQAKVRHNRNMQQARVLRCQYRPPLIPASVASVES